MNTSTLGSGARITALAAVVVTFLSGCRRMSELALDPAAGMNGGFEVVKSGLPVNWMLYTAQTVPTGSFDVVIDTAVHRTGRQSLKFVVRECSSVGGWHSPGFSHESAATPGKRYTVGFWVRNDGAELRARVGGLTATDGRYEDIVHSSETIPGWRHFEHTYTMPPGFSRLRLELNVLGPGTLWVDDVTITEGSGPAERSLSRR